MMARTRKSEMQKEVERAAAAKFGKGVETRFRTEAPDAAERLILREQQKASIARKQTLEEERKSIGIPWDALLTAAEFCVAVDAGEPSLSQLREATRHARRYTEIKEDLQEIKEETEKVSCRILMNRCTVLQNKVWCYEQIAWGDTWEEVLEKLKAK